MSRCTHCDGTGDTTYAVHRTMTDALAGQIAYQLTKRLVIDMPTARAAVDAVRSEVAKQAVEARCYVCGEWCSFCRGVG